MQRKNIFGLTLLACFLWSSSSNADEVCPSGTVGLCDPDVFTTIVETIVETSNSDGQGTLTITETTLTTTVDTVTNEDSGDLLKTGNGYVTPGKEGDMDKDWGGQGPATISSGSTCGQLGTDNCAQITGSGNSTSTMGVSNMGTTFKQTIDISDLNITKGGKTTYSIKVDKQDSSDSIYMHITGTNGSSVSFSGTDVLSASGVSSGYAEYTGAFDFANSLTTIIVEIGGRDINLAIGPLFDDVSINVLYNVINTIVLQTITTIEQYVYNNGGATETEIEIVKDIFEHNDIVEPPNGDMYFEPIEHDNDMSYDTVETELELPDFEMDFEIEFDLPDFEMEFDTGNFDMPDIDMSDIEMEMDLEIMPPPDMPPPPEPDMPPPTNVEEPEPEMQVTEVKPEPEPMDTPGPEPEPEVEAEPEPEPEPVDEPKDEPEPDVKEEIKEEPKEEIEEVKEEPKEIKVAEKKEEPVKVQKKIAKQKAGSKLVKEMGDASRYDSGNQLKTLLIMNVIADTKSFFVSRQFKEIEGFFTSEVLPDSNIPDNNVAAYLMYVDDGGTMNKLIDLQYK